MYFVQGGVTWNVHSQHFQSCVGVHELDLGPMMRSICKYCIHKVPPGCFQVSIIPSNSSPASVFALGIAHAVLAHSMLLKSPLVHWQEIVMTTWAKYQSNVAAAHPYLSGILSRVDQFLLYGSIWCFSMYFMSSSYNCP